MFASVYEPTALAFDKSGNLYVSSSGFSLVEKFSSTGTDLGTFAAVPNLDWGLAFDKSGNFYVGEFQGNSVEEVSPMGTLLGTFASLT